MYLSQIALDKGVFMLADTLLIIDLQVGICTTDNTDVNLTTVVNGINKRIQEYWSHDKPIIFIQQNVDLWRNQFATII